MNNKTEDFSFTPRNIERIKKINSKLKKEEERIRPFENKLSLTLKKQVQQKELDDFNIYQNFSVFSNNADCNKRHNVEEGAPFWEIQLSLFNKDTPECFFKDSWNESYEPYPVAHLFFCYTMYILWFNSQLSWKDILDINEVWIELKVDYQFIVKRLK